MSILVGLEILSAILTTVANGAVAAQNITSVINKARSEGRDISDEELKAIQEENNALETQVLNQLKNAE